MPIAQHSRADEIAKVREISKGLFGNSFRLEVLAIIGEVDGPFYARQIAARMGIADNLVTLQLGRFCDLGLLVKRAASPHVLYTRQPSSVWDMARQLRAELGGASAEDSDHVAADGDDAVWRDLVERYAASPQARDYAPEPAVEYNVPRAGHIASTGKQRGRARVAYERRPAARNAELVRAASAGDETALRELVARHSGLVWSVARSHRLSHADAGDVVQSTWLKLVQHLGAIKNPEAVAAWLATTARRECLRVIDDSRIEIPLGDDLPEPQDKRAELDEAQLRSERDSLLWQAVSLLGPDDQALVRMLASDPPASYAEISAALDMPIGSIGPTRARCLERLRARCEQLSASGPPLQPAADGCA